MWQLANTRYVYDEGFQYRPSNLIKSLVIVISLAVLIAVSSLGIMQIERIAGIAGDNNLLSMPLPTKPTLSPVIAGATDQDSAELTKQIVAWMAKHPNHKWSVSVQGLKEDTRVVNVGNDSFQPTSLYKILLVPAFFEKYSLEDLDKIQLNDQPVRVCFEKMLLESNNPCGEAIANQLVSWREIDKNLHAHGYSTLNLNNPEGMEVTAKDITAFMSDFYDGKLTNKEERDYIVSLLERQIFRRGIPAGCPECKVINKTGDNIFRHDVAIVEYGEKAYTLSILSDGGNYAEIADLTQLIHQAMSK